jgi:hypothetical protein
MFVNDVPLVLSSPTLLYVRPRARLIATLRNLPIPSRSHLEDAATVSLNVLPCISL